MFVSLLIASTLSLSAPDPAIARPASEAAASASAPVAAPARSESTRYCVVHTPTGSRIPRKLCRTAAEWIARDGVAPDFFNQTR